MGKESLTRALVVVRWPLGGIRTYMKYVYKHIPKQFSLTIIASSTQEDEALKKDAEELGATLIIYKSRKWTGHLYWQVFKELSKKRYALIHSHGLISAVHAYLANIIFRVPHIMTIHGVIEERFLRGWTRKIKLSLITHVLKNIDVLYGVSNDIMSHYLEKLPALRRARCRKIVIMNGIDITRFNGYGHEKGVLRKKLDIGDEVFLIGFVGRFMEEKGFRYLIEAVDLLENTAEAKKDFKVLAVGSGDYINRYKKLIKSKNLEHKFMFIPFQQDIKSVYGAVDVVVMPSICEACPLQPMEAMCLGIPMIASDCIGLREVVSNTPVRLFECRNVKALADALQEYIFHDETAKFTSFSAVARERFDVRNTSAVVDSLFKSLI